MTRLLYRRLLHLHPACFRERFAEEMLWIFDQEPGVRAKLVLFGDGIGSVARQWLFASAATSAGAGWRCPLFFLCSA